MSRRHTPLSIVTAIAITAVFPGCATQPPEILSEGPSMRDIYYAHMNGTDDSGSADRPERLIPVQDRPLDRSDQGLTGYTRDASNEINNLFPRLPNPTLCMFVDPHLTDEGVGIPGYTTCFPMYETVEYALPGEVWR